MSFEPYVTADVALRGLVHRGRVLPGTDRVLRDPGSWWPDRHRSTRPRGGAEIDLFVMHWTAGHITHEEVAGPITFATMLARKSTRRPGMPLDCAVPFVVGWGGSIWQTADLATACVHVGDRGVIRRSAAVECRWPGTRRWAERLGITGRWSTVRLADGGKVEAMLPSAELVAAVVWLAETLASLRDVEGSGVAIPRRVPATNARFTRAQQRAHRGGQEHGQVPGSLDKIDCVGLLNRELAAAGWATAA